MKKAIIKYLFFLVILVPCLMLGTSCDLLSEINSETATSPTVTGTGTPINPTWTYPGPASPGATLISFVEVVEKVRPSVVVIETETGGGTFAHDPTNPYTHPFYWAPFILMGNWL